MQTLETGTEKIYQDDKFRENFRKHIMQLSQQGIIQKEEITPFTISAYHVALYTDYIIRLKSGEENLPEPEFITIKTDFKPETKYRKIRFDKQDMFFLMEYLNEKLETNNEFAFDSRIFSSEIKKVKTIDGCVTLFYEKYRQRTTQTVTNV